MADPAILRALEGLSDRTGRTVVVVGPPASGKSSVLAEIGSGVGALGGRSVRLGGTYRARAVPYGALEGLERTDPLGTGDEPGGEPGNEQDLGAAPMAPVAVDPETLPGSRRRDGRVRTTFLGEAARTRGPPARDVDAYWGNLLREFRATQGHPVALLADDGTLFDSESRTFLLELSRRARLRPLLVAIALDSTNPGTPIWEEALLGRPDVDWVRLSRSQPDPREVHRLSLLVADLPSPALRALGYVTLLNGEAPAVLVSRIARLSVAQLKDALQPAVDRGLVRLRDGVASLPDRSSIPVLETLLPENDRRNWHLEIAEGLAALSAEPPLARRVEIAHHYLAAGPGPLAMARLLEAAEASLGLSSFDEAARLLEEAIACLLSIPPADRPPAEPEMRMLQARALFFSGRPVAAEGALREGIEGALRAGTTAAEVASWLEPLLLAMQAVGPRTSLATTAVELAERCHDRRQIEPEVLLETLLADYLAERSLPDRSREAALRAAQIAHRLPERHLQALGLFTMGLSRVTGAPAELERSERFLRAARYLLHNSRRWELDYVAGEFECRLLEAQGALDRSLELRRQSVAALERARLPSIELLHQLGIAQILLDRRSAGPASTALDQAAQLTDRLHLFPPSPALLHLWVLEGRRYAVGGSVEAARDRWAAVADLPGPQSLPRFRAEALLRGALLEQAIGRPDAAAELASRFAAPELVAAVPAPWAEWASQVDGHAGASEHGGGPLPRTVPAPPPARGSERRERRRK